MVITRELQVIHTIVALLLQLQVEQLQHPLQTHFLFCYTIADIGRTRYHRERIIDM